MVVHSRLIRPLFVFLFLVFAVIAVAQETSEPDTPPEKGWSLALGGLVTPDTGYLIAAGTISRDRLSYHGDIIVDLGFPAWDDGSSGDYYHVGGMLGLRLTAFEFGRGILAGIGLGGGYSSLTVTDGSLVTTVSDWQIGIVPQVGVRFGNSRGLFGEAVLRLMLPLKPIFVYVGNTAPETELEGFTSIFRYQAIYMPSAISVSRFYLGFGYTFSN